MTTEHRKEGWPERLSEIIEEKRGMGFVWGSSDCGMFASDIALALTGKDAAEKFRGKYKTEIGAARALKRNGFNDVVEAFEFSFPEKVEKCNCNRGDIAVVMEGNQRSLGVVEGIYIVCMTYDGITFKSIEDALFILKV